MLEKDNGDTNEIPLMVHRSDKLENEKAMGQSEQQQEQKTL